MAILAAGNVKAEAEDIEGYAIASEGDNDFYEDPNVQWLDGGEHVGRVTVIDVDDPDTDTDMGTMADYAMNDDGTGSEISNEMDQFSWDATRTHPSGWDTSPDNGNNIMFLAEYNGTEDGLSNNYVFAAHLVADDDVLPDDPLKLCLRYEPIPTPVENTNDGQPIGSDYVNISIENFKYTDWDQANEQVNNRGTFDVFDSYGIYIRGGEFGDWEYLGN
ncbi:MAG: hypothetical protein ACOC53_07785, partial [Candidatus Saliniplasma sp.]